MFVRDRERFAREFPEWQVRVIEPMMPFRYVLSGGVSLLLLLFVLNVPIFVAFLTIADPIIRGVYLRGNFTEAAAALSSSVLAAYGFGLLAIVLIRAAVASFLAQGDTKTPMYVSLSAVAVNVAMKIALYEKLGISGLAFATAVGAWINFGLLVALAMARDWMSPDAELGRWLAVIAVSALLMAMILHLAGPIIHEASARFGVGQNETELAILALSGLFAYLAPLFVLVRGLHLSLRPKQ